MLHPVARVFQIVLLSAGLLFAGGGYILYYADFKQSTTVNFNWSCEMRNEKQTCTTDSGSLNPGDRDEATMALTLGGVLVLSSIAVTLGGRRRENAVSTAPGVPGLAGAGAGPGGPAAPGFGPGAPMTPPGPGGPQRF